MLSKQQIKGFLQRAIKICIVSSVLFSMMTLSLEIQAPHTARAAVTVSGVLEGPPGMMIGPGMLFPALGINVASDAGETLASVKVNILIPSGSSFDPTTGLAPLSATDNRAGITIYKDNKSAGSYGQPDPPEDFHDTFLL